MNKFVVLALLPLVLYGEATRESSVPDFWSTGPLLAPSGDVLDPGHVYYEPFVYWIRQNGEYNDHWKFQSAPHFTTASLQLELRFGLVKNVEFDINPIVSYNYTHHARDWTVGDIPTSFNFSLSEDDPDRWYHPSVILRVSANLPVGKYQKLKASKEETDLSGTGSWYPGVGLIFYHAAHLWKDHYLSATAFFTYQFGTPSHVKGLSYYGGGPGTHGTAYAGNFFQEILSFEFSLNQNWVLALDTEYDHFNKSRFKGRRGGNETTLPSSELFSLAPAIEYNFSDNVGVIAGSWFTIAGRNTPQFTSAIIAIAISV